MHRWPPNMGKTAVIPNKHLQITGVSTSIWPMLVFSVMLSRPEFCTKLPPVVKLPPDEKIGIRSNDVIIFYVNFNILSTAPGPCGKPLWTTMWRMWKSISFQQLLAPFRKTSPAVENSRPDGPASARKPNPKQITSPIQRMANRDFFIEFVVNPPKQGGRKQPSISSGKKCL